jgi:ABC-type sulfate/molybdate transport systems ATPase subunit
LRQLALALAFIGDPDLVVLDEPTASLDVESCRRLWEVVRTLGNGRSILCTTHYLEEAQALATRILVADHGRLLFDGEPQAMTLAFVVFAIVGVTLYQFGVGIAQQRGRPWERYLRALPVSTAVRFIARIVTAVLFGLLACRVDPLHFALCGGGRGWIPPGRTKAVRVRRRRFRGILVACS